MKKSTKISQTKKSIEEQKIKKIYQNKDLDKMIDEMIDYSKIK